MLNILIIQRQDQSLALKIVCAEQDVFKWCIATLKQAIPQPLRRFDFAMRYWVISEEAAELLASYLSRMQAVHSAEIELADETEEECQARESKERERQRERPDEASSHSHGANARKGRRKGLRLTGQIDLESAYGVLYLAPGAPLEVIQAVYRTLAKLHHPDIGGSTETMAEINEAYHHLVEALKRDANAA
jgi:hypothetical protein